MRKEIPLLLALSLAVSGCQSIYKPPLSGCDHESGWSDQIRAMAMNSYNYAQLAVNAYPDEDPFDLGDEWQKLEEHLNNEHGMAYDVWQRNDSKETREIVLAFRGTELSSLRDWRHGNFGTKQNADGVAAFDRAREMFPDARFSVTGHSLGGGIATQVSLSRPNVRSYIFNGSPRFKAPDQPADNPRISVVEYGEVLKVGRLLGREATQDYYSIGCTGGNPFSQHESASLAVCLTQIASWEYDQAKESLSRNGIGSPRANSGYADCRKRRR